MEGAAGSVLRTTRVLDTLDVFKHVAHHRGVAEHLCHIPNHVRGGLAAAPERGRSSAGAGSCLMVGSLLFEKDDRRRRREGGDQLSRLVRRRGRRRRCR